MDHVLKPKILIVAHRKPNSSTKCIRYQGQRLRLPVVIIKWYGWR